MYRPCWPFEQGNVHHLAVVFRAGKMPCSSAGRRKIPLTEDKIKEQQPAAQPVRQPRRQKLRSLWAQFQCRGVLRRHRIRRKRQHRWEKLWHKLLHNPIAPMVGETLYAIGFSAEYAVVRTGRRLQHGLQRLLQTVRYSRKRNCSPMKSGGFPSIITCV